MTFAWPTFIVAEWGDIIIKTKVVESPEKESEVALNYFTQSFKKIAENSEYAALRFFAKNMERSLRTEKIKSDFFKQYKFQLELQEEIDKLEQEKQLNDIKLSRLTQVSMKRKINELLVAEESCTSNSSNIVPEPILNNNNINLNKTQSVSVQLKNDGIKLHHRYVKGEKTSSDELKRMSSGLSSMLDLVDCSPEGQRSVLGEEILNELCSKYYKKYQINSDYLPPKIEETLLIVEKICKANKNIEARTYIENVIKRYPDLKRSLKAVDSVLEVFEEQEYLFDPIVAKNLGENDFVTSAWFAFVKEMSVY